MDEKPRFDSETSRRGLRYAVAGAILALLFLWLGFWKTVFVAALAGVGFFLGSRQVKLSDLLKKMINKWFPPKKE